MVQVTLPFGYPLVSGAESETLIYQGNVVRRYVLPNDPRTDSQLFQRRFLADMSKMRATCGTFGKGAMRAALGNRWGTALQQLIKADDGGRWTEAESAWDSAEEGDRDDWRAVAPFVATYNDPGKVFFCLARVIAQVLEHFTDWLWESEVWEMGQSAAALAWWGLTTDALLRRVKIDDVHEDIVYIGTWETYYDGSAYGGKYMNALSDADNRSRVYYYGRNVSFFYRWNVTFGDVDVYLDGQFVETAHESSRHPVGGGDSSSYTLERAYRGLHFVEVRINASNLSTQNVNVDAFEFL